MTLATTSRPLNWPMHTMEATDTIVLWVDLISGHGGHMLRTAVLVAAIVAAGALHAQNSIDVSGTVPDSERRVYLIELDHGSTPVDITITVSLSTPSNAGVGAHIRDCDENARLSVPYDAADATWGAGAFQVAYTTPTRSGVHQLLVSVYTAFLGTSSTFTGTASVSGGTIAQTNVTSRAFWFGGARTTFGRTMDYYREFNGPSVQWLDFSLDFGVTAHQTTFALTVDADPASSIRLLCMDSQPSLEIASWTGTNDWIFESASVTTPPFEGVTRFRLEFNFLPGPALAEVFLVTGADATLVSASDSFVPPKSRGGGNGCVAGAAGNLGIATLLPALALTRRRRRT